MSWTEWTADKEACKDVARNHTEPLLTSWGKSLKQICRLGWVILSFLSQPSACFVLLGHRIPGQGSLSTASCSFEGRRSVCVDRMKAVLGPIGCNLPVMGCVQMSLDTSHMRPQVGLFQKRLGLECVMLGLRV